MKTLISSFSQISNCIALILMLGLQMTFSSCGQIEKNQQKEVVETSTTEIEPQKSKIDLGPKIEAIIKQNSASGFASANQAQQKAVLAIAQDIQSNAFQTASEKAKEFVHKYGVQKDVQTLMDLSKPYLPQTAIWKGGTPGKPNAWDEPKNWSTNTVPDEDSYVIIAAQNTGHQAQPIIQTMVQVTAIEIQSGAQLEIRPNGTLLVDGTYGYSEGIQIHGGQLINEGEVTLKNIDDLYVASLDPKPQESEFTFYSEPFDFAFVSIKDTSKE